jgi:non-specific serine/threonine protein kinase
VALFTEEDLHKYTFAAVVEDGRKCFARGRVSNLHFLGNDIISTVKSDQNHKVIVNRGSSLLHFVCSCGFAYGGACEHVVATMLAANEHQAIQVGINWDDPGEVQDGDSDQLQVLVDEPGGKENDHSISSEPLVETIVTASEPVSVVEIPAEKPVARLYLSECDSMLLVEVRFAYYNRTVEFTKGDSSLFRLIAAQNSTFYKVHRSKARETSITSVLAEYDLMQYQTGFFTPGNDPRIWTLHELPRLAAEGFEVYGQETLKTANARNTTPKLSVSIKSKDNLFDCAIGISYDGISSTLANLIMAIRQGSRFVLLSDGTSGILPQEWIEKFAGLFAVLDADPYQSSLKIKESHVALAGILFDMADIQIADTEFQEKRDAFNTFKGVEKCNLPENFTATMRPYQLAGYEWFYFLKKYRFGGCLADDMGLGKTIQALALLLKEKESGVKQPSLVIVPTSLLFNWQREAQKFAPSLELLCYHGSGRSKYTDVLNMPDVILTSYGTILRDINLMISKFFHYVILDEAQVIKNPASRISRALKQLRCNHRLALSGTPIENNLSELWSLSSFLNPGMLGSFRNFATNFIKPIEKEMNEQAADVLRKLIFPYILRRTKQQVAKDLPPKNEIILYAEMLPKQKTIYDITKETYRGKIQHSLDKESTARTQFQILEGMLRLRQICCHPKMIDPTFSCDSGKFQLIEESIMDVISEGHRILVFSQFVKALELMKERIAEKGVLSEILTGATRDRQAVVDRFQNQNGAPVFFISLKAGGTGLNLTSADYVIHMDPWWNPSAENQASDRAYRIGQTRPVFVYKMITKDSIEERVLQMQERKQNLMQSVIHTENSFFKQLTRDDVLAMFT